MLSVQSSIRPPLQLGNLKLASRYVLAPLAGYTNMPFRLAVRQLGGIGLATTDLVNARALLRGSRKSMELVDTCPDDQPLSIQLYGADPADMSAAAKWCENYGVASIDINMGCPVHKVTKGGGGSAMMCDPVSTVNQVATVVQAVRIPVTVKMRLGWDETAWSAPHFAREFEKVGIAGLIIHGRTRAQGFSGAVCLEGIKAVVDAVERIPIIGNGDVRNLADAQRMLTETGCAGLAIGRGALLNPWIFSQLTAWEETGEPGPRASYEQHLEFMHQHYHLLVNQRGEHFASLTFRKVANWYCRVLHPGRAIQQRLMYLENAAAFDVIIDEIGDAARSRGTSQWVHPEPSIAVPRGPIEHW